MRPGSRSRSSTATSARSGSSTSRASTRRGGGCGRCSPRSCSSSAQAVPVPRRQMALRLRQAAQRPAAEPLDPGSDRGRRGSRDRSGTCAGTCATCTTSWPTASGRRRPRAAIAADRDPDAEAWIFLGRHPAPLGRRPPRRPARRRRLRRDRRPTHPLALRQRLNRFASQRSTRLATNQAGQVREGAPNPTHAASGVLARIRICFRRSGCRLRLSGAHGTSPAAAPGTIRVRQAATKATLRGS